MLGNKTIRSYGVLKKSFSQVININKRLQSTAETIGKCDEVLLKNAKPFEAIPGPKILPILGSTWSFLPIVGRYSVLKLHLANRHKRQLYGDVWREKFGKLNAVISLRPDDMEALFRNEGPYPSRGEFQCIKAYRESRKQWYRSTGLLILEGKEWQDLRRKTQKHLMKPKAILEYVGLMQEVASDFVKRIIEIQDSNHEVPPNFLDEMYKWSLESVALVGLDTRLGCLDSNATADSDGLKIIQSVQTQFALLNKLEGFLGNLQIWKYIRTPKWKQFEKASDEFSEIAFKYINRSYEASKKQGDDKDLTLLQALCATEGLDVGGALVTVADMLFGGIDTTSHTAAFILYELAKNPDKQELLYQEIKQHIPSSGSITPQIFPELRYLKFCLKEALRLHPIIPVAARVLDQEIVISGYRIPPKTNIVVLLQEICLDEKYFPNASRFIPERWEKKENFNPFSYMPFGFGPRSCIGRRLAELEIICLIAEIIRKFKVEYHHEDIDIYTKFVNTPDKPLRFRFIERR